MQAAQDLGVHPTQLRNDVAMESFFSSFKTERTSRKLYRTRDEAKADVFDYIKRLYNPKRHPNRVCV